MSAVLSAILILSLVFRVESQLQDFFRSEYLDHERKVQLRWTKPDAFDVIEFQVTAAAEGWVGVGFSPSGGMDGSDIVVGWSTRGDQRILDLHGKGHQVFKDQNQSYELLELKQEQGNSSFRFSRKTDTCDIHEDFLLTEDTITVIYAYSHHQAFDEFSLTSYHGPTNRGKKSIRLFDLPSPPLQRSEDGIFETTATVRSAPVPEKKSEYWCRLLRSPQGSVKRHIVAYEPVISENTRKYIHHICLSRCKADYTESEKATFENFIQERQQGEGFCFDFKFLASECSEYFLCWAPGTQALTFPEDTGLPIPAINHDRPIYWKLEMHYENYDLVPGLRDSSGFKFFLTEDLRRFDIGLLMITSKVDYTMLIPPKQKSWTTVSLAPPECTQRGVPEEGFNIFASNLHAHLVGKRLTGRHFRNGIELPPIDQDSHYDFDFQRYRISETPRKILPGDTIALECHFSTSDRDFSTLGGWTSNNEMCSLLLLVYPFDERRDMSSSWSGVSRDSMNRLLDLPPGSHVDNSFDFRHSYLVLENETVSADAITLEDYLDNVKGWDDADLDALRKASLRDNRYVHCYTQENKLLFGNPVEASIPTDFTPYQPPPRKCSN